jgi:hypothetical protein
MPEARSHETERQKLQTILKDLRPHFSKGVPDIEILAMVLRNGLECSPAAVEAFARKKKTFSTADVMNYFMVGKYKVAGAVAALRGAGKLEAGEPTGDGYSTWRYVP